MKLKLSDWASIAEVVGALAIVISLIYVGVQVTDNTAAIRSTATNDATATMQAWYLEMGSNRQASDVWFDGISSHVPIDTHDEFQYMMSMHSAMMGMQNSYLLSQEGTIDVEFREATTRAIVAVKDLPGMDRYWRQRKEFFHADFAEYVDELLTQEGIEPLDMYKRPDLEDLQ